MVPISTKDFDLYKKKAPCEFDSSEKMPLTEHLQELRGKIIISLLSFFIASLFGFYLSSIVIKLLTNLAPQGTLFLQIKPGEFFFTSVRISLYIGITLSSPILFWQLGNFILPGLNNTEKKALISFLSFAPILFYGGIIFAYFCVIPSVLNFLFGYGKDIISSSISIEHYVSFTLMILAICGTAFLMPVAMLVLGHLKIINSKILFSNWRYAILLCTIFGALLTPTPDPLNMSIVASILITLYFISIALLKFWKL